MEFSILSLSNELYLTAFKAFQQAQRDKQIRFKYRLGYSLFSF